jgi:hypothetical protein
MQKPIPQRTNQPHSIFGWEDIIITNHQISLFHHPQWNIKIAIPIRKLGFPWMIADDTIIELEEKGVKPIKLKPCTASDIDFENMSPSVILNLRNSTYFGTKQGYLFCVNRKTTIVGSFINLGVWVSHITSVDDGIIVGCIYGQVYYLNYELCEKQWISLLDPDQRQIQFLTSQKNIILLAKPASVLLIKMTGNNVHCMFEWDFPLSVVSGMPICGNVIRVYTSDSRLYSMTIPELAGKLKNPTELLDHSMELIHYNSVCFQPPKEQDDADGEEDDADVDAPKLQNLYGVITSFHGLVDTYLVSEIAADERQGTVMIERYYLFPDEDWGVAVSNTLRNPAWNSKGGSFVIDDILRVYVQDVITVARILEILLHEIHCIEDLLIKSRILALYNYVCISVRVSGFYVGNLDE